MINNNNNSRNTPETRDLGDKIIIIMGARTVLVKAKVKVKVRDKDKIKVSAKIILGEAEADLVAVEEVVKDHDTMVFDNPRGGRGQGPPAQ
ncbi:hypothetical protein EYC84_008734 [Monilinia fructicola]|uniref:Uncharacterized protein n=1 Tax=Monilinia fructicola TaxID=38448 RepID=A0A5M9JA55_MONFR|nr:hypothetical protein EYC84_008734 [Monilinia fructicola]